MCGLRLKGEGVESFCAVPKFKQIGDFVDLAASFSLQDEIAGANVIEEKNPKNEKQINIWTVPERRRTGLGGIMNYAIIDSQLNFWGANSTRTRSSYVNAIRKSLEKVVIKRIPLGQRIFVCGDEEPSGGQQELFSSTDEFILNLAHESSKRGTTARGIMFDEITSVHQEGGKTTLNGMHLQKLLTVTGSMADRIKQSYSHEWAAIGKGGRHVFCMFLLSTDSNDQIKIEDVALFLTSRDYFNVDAGPEVIMVNKLIDENRKFMKPYRLWNESGFIPDFRLLDTLKESIIEVWGMNTNQYINQKKKKIAYYMSICIKLIEWTVRDVDISSITFPPADA